MKRLTEMAGLLRDCKSQINDLSLKLAQLQKNESRIELEDIPELMRELDMKNFTLTDGTKIEVIEDLKCGISEERKDAAHAWLRDNKFGGIIKEQRAKGTKIPAILFGLFPFSKAKVIPPKG